MLLRYGGYRQADRAAGGCPLRRAVGRMTVTIQSETLPPVQLVRQHRTGLATAIAITAVPRSPAPANKESAMEATADAARRGCALRRIYRIPRQLLVHSIGSR